MKLILVLFYSLCIPVVFAQQKLTFEDVMKRTLESNYDILLVRNNYETAQNNNNIGAAGYLPIISANGDQSWSQSNTRQEYFSGQVNEKNGARNTSLTASVRLEWTLFDGFGMFARDKRLQFQEDLASMNLRAQMEMTVYQASILYHTLVLTQRMQTVYEDAVALSSERLVQISLKKQHGAANDFEWLQAKLDMAADSSTLVQYQNSMTAMKRDLGYLMGDSTLSNYDLESFPVNFPILDFEPELQKALDQNTDLLLQKSMIAVTDQQKKEVQSRYYPQLIFYAQASYTKSSSQVGLLQSNRSLGPGIGLTLRWTILDGLSNLTELRNIKVQQSTNELKVAQQRTLVKSEFSKAFNDYESARKIYELENRNALNSKEILSIAQNSYDNGAITALELRSFQYSVVEAQNRQLQAELNYITAQLNLQLLTGYFKTLL